MKRVSRTGADVFLTILGMTLAACMTLFALFLVTPGGPQAKNSRLEHEKEEVEAIRRRAVKWATPDCRSAVVRSVVRETTEDGVIQAAWKACPNHPDAGVED